MHDQRVPVGSLQLSRQMASHIIVDFSNILQEKRERYLALDCSTTLPYQRRQLVCQQPGGRCTGACVPTNRNEEAACAFTAPEEVAREQLQPRVVSIEYYVFVFLLPSPPKLGEPGILRSQGRGGIALSEVKDEIEERRNRAGCEGLDARHGDCRRSCVRSKRDGSTISNQTRYWSDSGSHSKHEDRRTSGRIPSRYSPQTRNRSSAHQRP
jgi:hypothetical protein